MDIEICKITLNEVDLSYKVLDFTSFGKDLCIELPSSVSETFTLQISYISRKGPALCWLLPSQTAGKKYPYLFTQGESCLNRSLFPCFDSPAYKTTFNYYIHVEKPLTVVASAELKEVKDDENDKNWRCFTYEMKFPIPSYLVALAAGNIVSKPIGPRSSVWSEPEMIDECQKEFDEVTEVLYIYI